MRPFVKILRPIVSYGSNTYLRNTAMFIGGVVVHDN